MASLLLASNTYQSNTGSNTAVQNYGGAIHDAFANAGWVQVGSTYFASNASSWSTVVANGSSTVWTAQECWRMNDALANVAPVYITWALVTGTGYANSPSLIFRLGSGAVTTGASNGVNVTINLTGPLSGNFQVRGIANNSLNNCYFCGDTDRIMLVMDVASPMLISIERTHDAGGNNTTEGVLFFMAGTAYNGTGTGLALLFWSPSSGATASEGTTGLFTPANSLSGTGNIIQLYPCYTSRGLFLNPAMNYMFGSIYNTTPYSQLSFPYYGAMHNYLTLGANLWTNRSSVTASSLNYMIRWE